MHLIFATHNQHKTDEIKKIIGGKFNIINLKDLDPDIEDIPETSDTLQGNAIQKARFVYDRFHKNCFADDTGLEIEALNNRPGVYSARYAGEHCSFEDNINKVLTELKGIDNRQAVFKTVIALLLDKKTFLFEGEIKGIISTQKAGKQGFGYDPVFIPNGYNKTFAELEEDEKNSISHRAVATRKLVEFLKSI